MCHNPVMGRVEVGTQALLGRVSTTDALVKALRARILDGGFKVGEALREVELAQAYGVSRHSLRAALRTLMHDGLLRHEPFRGAFVPHLTAADVEEIYRLRRLIECDALELVMRSGGVPASMSDAVAALELLPPDAPWSLVAEADLAVHHALVHAAGSPRLERIASTLEAEARLSLVQLWFGLDTATGIAAELRTVLDAIAVGDREAADARLREHLRVPPAR